MGVWGVCCCRMVSSPSEALIEGQTEGEGEDKERGESRGLDDNECVCSCFLHVFSVIV